MADLTLPDYVTRIGENEPFSFECHPGVECFTNCCHQLDLALTPYDILRLRKVTGIPSKKLIENYIIIEQTEQDIFPHFYLTMIDDGEASCVFLKENGCSVYTDRPGACRTYPMGRAAIMKGNGTIDSFHVLLKEPHCEGFQEKRQQTALKYTENQNLEKYNLFNDRVAEVLQHEKIKKGISLTKQQLNFFTLALYDLDTYRQKLEDGRLPDTPALTNEEKEYLQDDENLLIFAIDWTKKQLFLEAERR